MSRFGHRALAPLLLLFLAMPAAEAQVYKWIDPDGSIHYGDRPPPDTRTEKIEIPVTSFGGPTSVDYTPILRRPIQTNAPPADECGAACCGACRNASLAFQSGNNGMTTGDAWTGDYLVAYGYGRGSAGFRSGGPRPPYADPRGGKGSSQSASRITSQSHGMQWPVAARGH